VRNIPWWLKIYFCHLIFFFVVFSFFLGGTCRLTVTDLSSVDIFFFFLFLSLTLKNKLWFSLLLVFQIQSFGFDFWLMSFFFVKLFFVFNLIIQSWFVIYIVFQFGHFSFVFLVFFSWSFLSKFLWFLILSFKSGL
jgi:hypothetical protein